MARSFTAEELLERITLLVDDERFILATRAQYLTWIGVELATLWAKLCDSMIYPDVTDQTVVSDGEQAFALAADCYQVLRVMRQEGDRWVPLKQIHIAERHRWERDGAQRAVRYFQEGVSSIILFPTPPSGQTYRVTYVAAPAKITSHTDVIDGIAGWEEFIVLRVAMKAKAKEGSSVEQLQQEVAEISMRIDAEKNRRNLDTLTLPKARGPLSDEEWYDDPVWRRWGWY